jgi:hypothetical protein
LSEILAHGLLWLDVLRDYHGSIRSHNFRRFVTEGGLISFGIDQAALYRLAASYVDRILKGEKPADLPVQAPTKYETVLNIKTAKALGLEVPPSVFARADEVLNEAIAALAHVAYWALNDRPPFSGRLSLTGHFGRGWTCSLPPPSLD